MMEVGLSIMIHGVVTPHTLVGGSWQYFLITIIWGSQNIIERESGRERQRETERNRERERERERQREREI